MKGTITATTVGGAFTRFKKTRKHVQSSLDIPFQTLVTSPCAGDKKGNNQYVEEDFIRKVLNEKEMKKSCKLDFTSLRVAVQCFYKNRDFEEIFF